MVVVVWMPQLTTPHPSTSNATAHALDLGQVCRRVFTPATAYQRRNPPLLNNQDAVW